MLQYKMCKIIRDVYLTLSVIICSFGSHVTDATIHCLECTDMPEPQDCQTVIQCASSDLCYTKQIVSSGGKVFFDLGCTSATRCHASKRSSDITVCMECCHGDYCNNEGCGAVALKPPERGPVCFECDIQNGPDGCRDVTMCGPDQECSTINDQVSPVHGMIDKCPSCCGMDYCNNNCIHNEKSTP